MSNDPFRARDIKLIHIGKAKLGLSDDEYRSLLMNYGGGESSAKMNAAQRQCVLDRMKALGFEVQAKTRFGNRITEGQKWRLDKACKAKGWSGLDDPAASAFIKRTAKVDSWKFLTRDAATRVITGLEKWR